MLPINSIISNGGVSLDSGFSCHSGVSSSNRSPILYERLGINFALIGTSGPNVVTQTRAVVLLIKETIVPTRLDFPRDTTWRIVPFRLSSLLRPGNNDTKTWSPSRAPFRSLAGMKISKGYFSGWSGETKPKPFLA
ncbi:hypothetical protein CP10139811_1004 [Chlamydia ibidis]|uniref:Uncharacterized protein n=2 Tax=Chlamydia ibidis TaxID=1405396 RepID=S7KLU3_9CHLA|nr:hypothetical protein CP10139811_1004 [Chlamydia ibidis]EQM63065.1 hypothetical protein H359_0322 [Chlamydia ibidis 10-1398/6]